MKANKWLLNAVCALGVCSSVASFAKTAEEKADDVKNTKIGEVPQNIKDGAEKKADDVAAKTEETSNEVKDTKIGDVLGNAEDKASKTADDASDKANEVAHNVGDTKIGDVPGNVWDGIKKAANNVSDKATEVAGDVKEKAGVMAENVRDTVSPDKSEINVLGFDENHSVLLQVVLEDASNVHPVSVDFDAFHQDGTDYVRVVLQGLADQTGEWTVTDAMVESVTDQFETLDAMSKTDNEEPAQE